MLWTATIWGNFFPEMTSLIRPSPELADVSASAPHYGARVVIASEYLEEQETLHGWLLAYYIGLGVAAAVLTINTLLWLLRGQMLWITIVSIVANVAAWIWFIGVIRRQIEKVRTFRAGRKGEEHVVEQLDDLSQSSVT